MSNLSNADALIVEVTGIQFSLASVSVKSGSLDINLQKNVDFYYLSLSRGEYIHHSSGTDTIIDWLEQEYFVYKPWNQE